MRPQTVRGASAAAGLLVPCAMWSGCGGATAASSGGVDGSASDGAATADALDGSSTLAHPPPPPSPGHPGNGADMVYAVNRFFLGDVDPDGTVDPGAWKSIGFDLDGVNTSDPTAQTNCELFGIPPSDRQQLLDGVGGIDNAFGQLLAAKGASDWQTALAASGTWTLLFQLMGNDGTDGEVGVPGAVYVGAPLGAPPKFDGSDVWPPTTDSAPSGSAVAQWGAGYMVDSSFYVTEGLTLFFDLAGANRRQARFPIRVDVLELQFAAGLGGVSYGVLSGIIDDSDFAAAWTTCQGGTGPGAQSYTDILTDRMSDSTTRCSGVSVAIGFTAVPAALGSPKPGLPAPNQCSDGGG